MNSNSILKCPVCFEGLHKVDKAYTCKNNHAYDIAKEGYVNLLLANQKNSKDPGDSKEMMIARQNFLNKNHYKQLSDAINQVIKNLIKKNKEDQITILDSGCGVGYYSNNLNNYLTNEKIFFYGIDISKEGIKQAAKVNKNIVYTVGSVFDLPIKNNSVDYLIDVFSPIVENEFKRVLKKDGLVIIISPGANHLDGLKKLLYENPYLNNEEKNKFETFELIDKIRIKYEFELNSSDEIKDLILMTPYYWNTDMKKIMEVIEKVNYMKTTAEFIISIFSTRE